MKDVLDYNEDKISEYKDYALNRNVKWWLIICFSLGLALQIHTIYSMTVFYSWLNEQRSQFICFMAYYDPFTKYLAQFTGIIGSLMFLVVAWKNRWKLPPKIIEKGILLSPILILLIDGAIEIMDDYLMY